MANSKVPLIKAKITKLNLDNPESKTKAYANATIGEHFVINGIRIIGSSKGDFVAMPSRSYKDENGNTQYSEFAHAITKEGHQALEKAVMNAFHSEIAEGTSEDLEDIEVIDEDGQEISMNM